MITQEIVDQMRQYPGVYIIGDTAMPRCTFPVVVLHDTAPQPDDQPAHIYGLEPRYKVEYAAEQYPPTAYLVGGPYSVDHPYGDGVSGDGLAAEAEFFKDIALRSLSHLQFARSLQSIDSAGHAEVSDLIERLEHYNRAHAGLEKAAQEQEAP